MQHLGADQIACQLWSSIKTQNACPAWSQCARSTASQGHSASDNCDTRTALRVKLACMCVEDGEWVRMSNRLIGEGNGAACMRSGCNARACRECGPVPYTVRAIRCTWPWEPCAWCSMAYACMRAVEVQMHRLHSAYAQHWAGSAVAGPGQLTRS